MTANEGDQVRVELSEFTGAPLDRGRSRVVEVFWWLAKLMFIQSSIPWPMSLKRVVLVRFGAKIGKALYIRPRVNIHFPWKLSLGDYVWIGEGTTILNLAPVNIESNVAIAHEVYIAAAGHDIRDPKFGYANAPVHISSGAWLATRSYVGPGVSVGPRAVVAAGAVVVSDVEPDQIVGGVPARTIGVRKAYEQ
ncbi:putative colanic acid biosynthesis acetyltransferase [Demequina maris]|uniref:putative colanic acid biosynthesis acetyltransferase n=1 Tax=Demequina maris TaxID=1638982 RepID=UPI000A8DFE73|nr:putative colanic acid biosynthesis acetyltransferase [Demequina maris]